MFCCDSIRFEYKEIILESCFICIVRLKHTHSWLKTVDIISEALQKITHRQMCR